MMKRTLCTMAGAALLLAGASSLALAQTPGYAYQPGYGAAPAYGQPAYGQPAYGQPAYGTAYRPACGGWGQPVCAPSNTATGAVVGSPCYMAPEQVRSARSVDARADIWSIGVSAEDLPRAISGPVVDRDQFHSWVVLPEDALDGIRHVRGLLEAAHDDGKGQTGA